MNERIKELVVKAGIYDCSPDDPNLEVDEEYIKLAELIVRECVSIVAKRKDQAIDDGWNVDEAMSMAEMDLEEHFGVTE